MNRNRLAVPFKQDDNALDEVARRFDVRITPAVLETIQSPADPVALQYLPDIRELDISPEERDDPIGDHVHSPVKGIVHRHRGRVLLKASSVCAVNCRFCFRKNMLGAPAATLNWKEMDAALSYIAQHPEISEVILTGGDPLVLSSKRLDYLLGRLEQMDHVKIMRIHSRVPVAAPERLNTTFLELLNRKKPLYMVLHVNHVQEITPEVEKALFALHKSGVVLLSQSVLLKGVNNNTMALENLFSRLLELRVKPYYLHHPDLVPGTGHFRLAIEEGQKLMRALRSRVSGLALPNYVLDIPGGYGKIPLENAYIEKSENGFVLTDHEGVSHDYPCV